MEIITAENITGLKQIGQAVRAWITEVVWAPNGRALAVAGADGITLYEAAAMQIAGVLKGHEGPVKGIAVSPDGGWIVSAGADTTVRLWNLRAGAAQTILRGHSDAVNAAAFSPDGQRVAAASTDRTVRLWTLAGEPSGLLQGHTDEVTAVVFCGAERVVTGSWDQQARVWDIERGECVQVVSHGSWVRHLAALERLGWAASASRDGIVQVWEVESGREIVKLLAHSGGADAVAFSPDGKMLATGGRDQKVKLWALPEGRPLHVLWGHEKPVLTVAFSPDGTRLASGSGDNTVRLWGVVSQGT